MFFGKHELQFPDRESDSVVDNLRKQKQALTGSSSIEIFSDWDNVLKSRPLDLPFYTAVHDRACIAIRFSEKNLSYHQTIGRVLESPIAIKLHMAAFLGGAYPVLRSNFIFPDNPANPLTLETPLNLREGDVQDFCRSVLADETLDLIMKHEQLPNSMYSSAFKGTGLAAILKKELGKIFGKLRPDIPRTAFFESVKHMESVFPTPTTGLSSKKTTLLIMAGQVQNTIIRA